MAAKRLIRYTCRIRLEEVVNLVTKMTFCFPRRELLEVIDEFNDDMQYLASTKGSSSALVGGRSCTCVIHCTSLVPFYLFFILRRTTTLK